MLQPTVCGRPLPIAILVGLAIGATVCRLAGASDAQDAGDRVTQILDETGKRGGLIVHLGCGDGALTARLRTGDGCLVQGLDRNADHVAKARNHIRSLGLYGPVSADTFDGKHLPYIDNTVNLLVADDLGSVAMGEVMRVLTPSGAAVIGGKKTVKATPRNTDEWTHFLHDPSGNPVARDQVVGPPRRLQWSDRPLSGRSHEHTPSVANVVSSGGRVFYFVDEAATTPVLRAPKWRLVARDAYNGILLWEQVVAQWWPHLAGWTSGPSQNQRRLVAVGNRVYATLGFLAPLTALDAATGKVIRVYDNTQGTEEVLWHQGTLLLSVRAVTEDRKSELTRWSQLSRRRQSPLYQRETQAPLLNELRGVENAAPRTVLALDADTGRVLWRKSKTEIARMRPLSLSVINDRVFYQNGADVVCLDLASGKRLWSASAPRMRVVCPRGVVCADDDAVTTLAVESGAAVWTQKPLLVSLRDAFVINGSLWLGGFKPYHGKGRQRPQWGPYFVTQRDLATGEVLKHIEPENPGHHHRCYRNKATSRYILGGRRGTELIDLDSGEVRWNSWARGVCMYGIMPANGLLYVPPNACGCYVTTKLRGFSALAARSEPAGPATEPLEPEAGQRLQRGLAFPQAVEARPAPSEPSRSWPTYRHDAQRSGFTPSTVPVTLRRQWQVDGGEKLTAPTVAGGKVLVASVEDHRVLAWDADSGRAAWAFTAGGRIDSAPTWVGDRVLFGCRDGYVYSLRGSDGLLAWRFRAAREDRRIVVDGQLESVWPTHGSVLVCDGVAYVTAGRNSYLDGGIDLYRLQARTGTFLSRTSIDSPDPATGRQPKQYGPNSMPGVRSDLLSGDHDHVYLRQMVLSKTGSIQEHGAPHLLTVSDFLDDTWPHRSYWIFGTHTSLATGCSGRDRNLLYGRLLAFDSSTLYGYGRKAVHWSNQFQDGPYHIFAVSRGGGGPRWTKKVPIEVRAMIVAGETLLIAGPPASVLRSWQPPGQGEGAALLALSTSDGSELGRYRLDAAPILDGMAAAGGRLYLSTSAGTVLCFGAP